MRGNVIGRSRAPALPRTGEGEARRYLSFGPPAFSFDWALVCGFVFGCAPFVDCAAFGVAFRSAAARRFAALTVCPRGADFVFAFFAAALAY